MKYMIEKLIKVLDLMKYMIKFIIKFNLNFYQLFKHIK